MKNIGGSGKYIYPVGQLSLVFRGKMMECIKSRLKKQALPGQYQGLVDTAWKKPWVVMFVNGIKIHG
ncbi:MAG TPA: hypothetical protein VJ455_06715 [Ignavibacteria bacterium]|nr:hypothetical protein [Ignavibacteria bacterium]